MTNRRFNRIVYRHLQREDFGSTHMQAHDSVLGYIWFFVAVCLVVCFMVLSHLGVAS